MGVFKIKKTPAGKFIFDLVAGNGQVICTSQQYASLDTCKTGIASVKKNCTAAAIEDQTKEGFETQKNPKWEVYTDKGGAHCRFRLKASNGEAILASQGYKEKASAMGGIESIKKNAPDADIEVVE